MKRLAIRVGRLLVAVYAGLCGILFASQRSLIYFPTPNRAADESTAWLEVPGATLRIAERPRPGAKALIYFGGNAEDVSLTLPEFAARVPDRALFMMHYRGYGGSMGRPSEAALHADAAALFDEVRKTHPEIAVVGRSLGTGIAVRLAATRPVDRLVLVTPFDSILNVARHRFPMIPVGWLLADRYESDRVAAQVTAPTLVIEAENDELIPARHTRALLAAFRPGIASLVSIAGTGHNTVSSSPDFMAAITRFLR